ncbi:peptidase inhibitor family I36 protein [Plantactinospora veratri]|uniref:Peptidase inhibitor family I36 protein n=1 Tax=Plantactinospora veratri TaxID=1436122 RepID=A0ABU7SNI5_9ACTN
MVTPRKLIVHALLATVGAAMFLAAGSTTASAATARNGVCESGEFCYYWGFNRTGSLSDFTASENNYGTTQPTCFEFKSAGTGRYQCIKNNAASAWNRSSVTVRVHYNSDYGGPYDAFAPGAGRNLNSTLLLDNASHKFL